MARQRITVSGAAGNQVPPVGLYEHQGPSLIVGWEDARNEATDVFAQRIDPSGVVAWTPDGRADIDRGQPTGQGLDAAGHVGSRAGVVRVWDDDRNMATGTDIYAAKVGLNGVLSVSPQGFSIE